jgi:hypothetical protein
MQTLQGNKRDSNVIFLEHATNSCPAQVEQSGEHEANALRF